MAARTAISVLVLLALSSCTSAVRTVPVEMVPVGGELFVKTMPGEIWKPISPKGHRGPSALRGVLVDERLGAVVGLAVIRGGDRNLLTRAFVWLKRLEQLGANVGTLNYSSTGGETGRACAVFRYTLSQAGNASIAGRVAAVRVNDRPDIVIMVTGRWPVRNDLLMESRFSAIVAGVQWR